MTIVETVRTHTMEFEATNAIAFRRGDHEAFGRLSRRHYRELHVHCYRMVGSYDEAEDLVQETFLRAWRKRETYEARAPLRAWLYRIATNVCIEVLRKRPRHSVQIESRPPPNSEFPWIQPYPDALLDAAAANDQPDAVAVARETIELAYLTTVQLLPAKQRAVLVLREVLGFSAAETADLLDETVAAVNSALQRARVTLRRRRDSPDGTTPPASARAAGEHVLLQRFVDAQQRADAAAMIGLLRADVRMTLSPDGQCWNGRDEVAPEVRIALDAHGELRGVAISANRQPAVAVYARQPGETKFRALGIVVLDVVDGEVREIATFASPESFARFDLPTVWSASERTTRSAGLVELDAVAGRVVEE